MSSIDLSRQVDESLKHYAGVRMQQGRVLTDDDFNAAASLDAVARADTLFRDETFSKGGECSRSLPPHLLESMSLPPEPSPY